MATKFDVVTSSQHDTHSHLDHIRSNQKLLVVRVIKLTSGFSMRQPKTKKTQEHRIEDGDARQEQIQEGDGDIKIEEILEVVKKDVRVDVISSSEVVVGTSSRGIYAVAETIS